MAERRKNRKKKDQVDVPDNHGTPTKDEYEVAKYLRQNLPLKKTSFLGHKVEYLIASKAVDCLLDSPWAKKSKSDELMFTSRDSIVRFLDRMLQHKFFHRAKKLVVAKDPTKKKKKEKESEAATDTTTKDKDTKKSKGKADEEEKAKNSDKHEDKKEAEGTEKKKEKKKIKLDMHLEQLFLDGNEVYVWIYDPIPMRTWIIGILIVVGAVLVCLFPLWPQIIRHYIYYLSVAAAMFLVFIIALAVLRLIVFVIIWAFSFGKHHLWLLPNLTEDVGFFESFWPLYHYEYKGKKAIAEKPEDAKEEEEDKTTKEEEVESKQEKSDSSSNHNKKDNQDVSESEQDSADENKEKADNNDNGFELVEAEDETKEC